MTSPVMRSAARRGHQCDRGVGEQRDVIDAQVRAQRRLQLLVERPPLDSLSHIQIVPAAAGNRPAAVARAG